MNGVKWNTIELIPSHTIQLFNFSFLSTWGVCNEMNDAIIKILPILPLYLFYHCNVLYSSQIYSTLLHFFSTVMFHIFVLIKYFSFRFCKIKRFCIHLSIMASPVLANWWQWGFITIDFGFSNYCILDFQIYFKKWFSSTEVVTRLSHDQVALFKTFRGTVQNCARQTINHATSMIKQVQLQLCD